MQQDLCSDGRGRPVTLPTVTTGCDPGSLRFSFTSSTLRPRPPMPYRFEFDQKHRILLIRSDGRMTDELVSELYWLIKKYSIATDATAGIWDISAVTDFDVSPEMIRDLVDRGPAMPDPTRRPRFIVTPAMFGLALSHMVEIAGEHRNPLLKLVLSRDEALAAIGVPSPRFEPLA